MKNTLENRSKFFAQYFGQVVGVDKNSPHLANNIWNYIDEYDWLKLKPLSSITDKDAIILAEIISGNNEEKIIGRDEYRAVISIGKGELGIWFDGELLFSDDSQDPLLLLECYDFLRSKGYALPYNGLSVEEQVSHGWVKLIEE